MRQICMPTFSPAPFHAGSVCADSFFTCYTYAHAQTQVTRMYTLANLWAKQTLTRRLAHFLFGIGTEKSHVAVLPVILLCFNQARHCWSKLRIPRVKRTLRATTKQAALEFMGLYANPHGGVYWAGSQATSQGQWRTREHMLATSYVTPHQQLQTPCWSD